MCSSDLRLSPFQRIEEEVKEGRGKEEGTEKERGGLDGGEVGKEG